jgi:hypothetical protein
MTNCRVLPAEIFGGKGGNSIKKTLQRSHTDQNLSIEILRSRISSACGHHVDSQIIVMVRYGTQLLIVDKLWQIYGIAQDVDRLLTVFCLFYGIYGQMLPMLTMLTAIWQKTKHCEEPKKNGGTVVCFLVHGYAFNVLSVIHVCRCVFWSPFDDNWEHATFAQCWHTNTIVIMLTCYTYGRGMRTSRSPGAF